MPYETIDETISICNRLFQKNGAFAEHARNVVKAVLIKDKSLMKHFQSLQSIGERIKFLQKHAEKFDFAATVTSGDAFIERDIKKALEFKAKGNELFKANQLIEARDMYTKALQYCPFDNNVLTNNKEYAIILANRSACTDKLCLFPAATQDIDDALKYGYPKEWHYKVYNRKGHSLFKDRLFADSREAFLKCRDMIGKSDMPTQMRDKWRIKTAKQMSVFNTKKSIDNDEEVLLGSPLTQLTSEEKCLMDDNSHTSQDIKYEEIIISERPFAAVLQDELAEGKICPQSLGLMTAPVPCSFGSTALFASTESRRKAEESFHQYEWSSLHIVHAAKLTPAAKLALRIITSIHPGNVTDVAKRVQDKLASGIRDKHLLRNGCSETDEDTNEKLKQRAINFLSLGNMTDQKQLPGEDCVALTALIAFFISCLQKGGFFNNTTAPTEENVAYLVERAILTTALSKSHVQSIFYSQGSVDKSKLWEMSRIPVKEFALGVYSDFAVARHKQKIEIEKESVNPMENEKADVILGYHKGTLFLQSIRDLSTGHQVNLQNVVGAGGALTVSGKSNLPPQLANMVTYKCDGKDCTLSFPLPEKTAENVITCPLEECGKETNIWAKRKRIVELRRDHDAARGKIEGISGVGGVKGIDEGITIDMGLLREWDAMVCRPNKDITSLEEDLTKAILLKHIETEHLWLIRWK